jgi:hypothetical protein
MINRLQIACAFATVAVIVDAVQSIKLVKRFADLKSQNDIQLAQLLYLVGMINDHDIELTDFDRIALGSIQAQS